MAREQPREMSVAVDPEQCTGFDWDRVNFLHSSCMELCLGFVLKIVLIIQGCFCCCCAALKQSQGIFCLSPYQRDGDAQEIGRECSHDS